MGLLLQPAGKGETKTSNCRERENRPQHPSSTPMDRIHWEPARDLVFLQIQILVDKGLRF